MTKEKKEKQQRRLLVAGKDSDCTLVIPGGARVTFCPNIPGNLRDHEAGFRGYALRVYADRTNASLIATIPDVRWFRDLGVVEMEGIPENPFVREEDAVRR